MVSLIQYPESFTSLNLCNPIPGEIKSVSDGLFELYNFILHVNNSALRNSDKDSILTMLWMIARYGEPDSRCNELSMSAIKFRQFANCGQTTGRKICLLFEQFGIKADYADDEDKIFIQFRSSDIKVQVADAAYLFVHRLLKTSDIPDFAFNKFKKADMRCFA